jgi:hypothetical protein
MPADFFTSFIAGELRATALLPAHPLEEAPGFPPTGPKLGVVGRPGDHGGGDWTTGRALSRTALHAAQGGHGRCTRTVAFAAQRTALCASLLATNRGPRLGGGGARGAVAPRRPQAVGAPRRDGRGSPRFDGPAGVASRGRRPHGRPGGPPECLTAWFGRGQSPCSPLPTWTPAGRRLRRPHRRALRGRGIARPRPADTGHGAPRSTRAAARHRGASGHCLCARNTDARPGHTGLHGASAHPPRRVPRLFPSTGPTRSPLPAAVRKRGLPHPSGRSESR